MKRHHPRMPPHLLILQMMLAVTLASGSMLAATVDSPEETPAAEEAQAANPRWETRRARAENFKSKVLLSRKAVEAAYAAESKLRSQRSDLRKDCRESLRKANRDQRVTTLITCMREDLEITLQMIHSRSESITATPGVSEEVRSLIIARSALLADAIGTIIDGLDAGVYETEEGLYEARKNLREKYFLPYWSLLPRMQAEQSLAWISHVLVRAKSLTEAEILSTEVTTKFAEAEGCLVGTEEALDAVAAEKDFQKMNMIISQARSTAISCIKIYRDAMTLHEQELAPPEEESPEPQWQKRSLRKLPSSRN